jgi:threonylcarbamoyladenosine tRNA methylthiotransferase MtaB
VQLDAPTAAIETHGCKLNQADSSALAADLLSQGFQVVAPGEPADVYVVNTCTVTHVADRKARQALRSARRRNPKATVVATGCYAERDPNALEALAEVDLVIGNRGKLDLVREVAGWRRAHAIPCSEGADEGAASAGSLRTRLMVKIQEGCDQVCAYCIVPKVRGRERSIPPDSIVARIEEHSATGHREAVLTGTQLGSYGFDLEGIDLEGLIARVLSETGISRLRVSSLQPQEIGPGLLDLWSDSRLCPHFHLPLQSGSDAVLGRMRRRYTAQRYLEAVEEIRSAVPGASVTADVIAGFPGETDEDFEATYSVCEQVQFATMHVFPYSVRPGTSAAHFDSQISPAVKSARMERLLELARRQAAEFRNTMLGSTRPVLWEEDTNGADGRVWHGLTDNYVRVAAHNGRALRDRITPVRLESVDGETVYGSITACETDAGKGSVER